MRTPESSSSISPATLRQAGELFAVHQETIYRSTDRMFAVLMSLQWIAGVVAALWIAPRTWMGTVSQTHIHVWAAIFLGGAISFFPVILAITRPGTSTTRYVIGSAQMMMSALLIYLTGGRIETHFHVFGSLAFLAFYRDWRVLVPATIVVAVDHFLRGVFWPQSVYGVLSASQWRWLEHAGWVLFEDTFLFIAIRRSVGEMWGIAQRTAELNDNEERYRAVVEQTAEGLVLADVETKHVLECNAAFANLLGYTLPEALTLTAYDFVVDEREAIDRRSGNLLDRRLPITGERRFRRKDDSIIEVEVNVSVIFYGGKDVFCTIVRDISERKRAEEALRESELRFRSVTHSASDAIVSADSKGNIVFWNKGAENTFGYIEAEILGQPLTRLMPEEYRAAHTKGLERFLATGESRVIGKTVELSGLRKDKTIFPFELSLASWRTTQGTFFTGIFRDITERKQAELALRTAHDQLETRVRERTAELATANNDLQREVAERKLAEDALRDSEERYRLLFESNPLPLWVYDLETLSFLAVNNAAVRSYGYSVEDFLGMTICDIRPPEDVPALLDSVARLSEELENTGKWRHRKKDSSIMDVEITSHTLDFAGRPARIVLAVDITERERAEKALQESQEWLTAVYQSSRDGIIVEENERIVYVNRSYANLFGYKSEDLIGQPVWLVSEQEPTGRMLEYSRRRMRGEKAPSLYEFRGTRRDGTAVDLEASVSTAKIGAKTYIIALTRDISERKRSEAEILFQKARFQQLFESAPLGILRVDEKDLIVDANKEFETIFQLSLSEIKGRPINEIVVPKTDLREAADLSSRTQQGEVIEKEALRKRKDGTLIPVQVYGFPIVVDQKSVGVFAIYIDLTDRKRMEVERQAVIEVIQGVIATPNLDELFKLVHRSISKILYAENCFVALHEPSTDLMHFEFWVDKFDPCPLPRPVGIGFSSYVLRTGKPLLLTEELTLEMVKRGEVKHSGTFSPSWLGIPLRTASRTIGVLAVQHYENKHAYTDRDLEFLDSIGSQIALAIERKRADQALQEANKRAFTDYERLVERIATLGQTLGSARDLTIIFRALRDFAVASVPCDGMVISLYDQDKQTRKVAYCWTDQTEYDPKDVADVPVRDGTTGRAIKSGWVVIDNDFQQLLRAGRKPVIVGSEHTLPRSALSAAMTVMGRTVGCVEIQSYQASAYEQEHATAMRMAANLAANAVENVTLSKREQFKEEQLRQSQKMESIGTLAGGIAHDFNNLMTAVTGYSELALRSLEKDHALRPKIEEIKKAGERAASLTGQLLAFSRKQMMQPRVLDLNAVVTGMGQMLPRIIGEHIDLRLRLSNSLGQVKADPGQIEQVLLNLAVNARDAMPEGGTLTIKTENVHLTEKFGRLHSVAEPGHYVVMSVSDTGCGMDAETQSHIFEPFFTTKEVGKGTGLGLSTVYGIVQQSGGIPWVYSEVGKGTIFKIYLPRVNDIVESEAISSDSTTIPRGHETVLLVEDEDVVRDLSKEILESYGYSVLVASNGKEALRIGREFEGQIDLLITDVIMPQMSGSELAWSMSAIRPETRVLYMSGFTDDAIIHHGVLDEGVFFIQKPFSPDSLALKAREVLDNDKPLLEDQRRQIPIGRDSRIPVEGEQLI